MQGLTSVFPTGLKTFWNSDTLTETQKLHLLLEELSQELTKMTLESYVKTDWALKSSGATIDTQRTSQTYDCRESWVCRILYFFWTANPPDTILQPNVSPGSCWAFSGHQGQVVIKLPARVHPTAITVQHITKDVSPSGTVISAPKDITAFGVDAAGEEESLLGTFTYNVEKEPMQTFPLKDVLPPRAFSYVKILVKSNWGNPWYTCIYRVQVHGRRETQKASAKIQDE
ncbi:SUN domain-containing protein 5-like [Manacus candei]|uniref:SUN domain-containing protein 5-like n=1 Tax=Manacus candei TaxID=415023 RepID=UPI00222804C5|nr:SUN domain-containing protein 5-like [Manacus candei]